MKRQPSGNRMVHYDLLRILAAFSVVMLHTSAQFWYDLPVTDTRWLIANSYNALSRFGVPIFIMLSGALFLSGFDKTDLKRLYTHNILRLLILYIVWSCIYGLIDCTGYDLSQAPLDSVFREMLYGRYHLWFLPMLIGIYMLLPILRVWIASADEKNIRYFLILFLLFQIGPATVTALFPYDEITYIATLIQPYMVCGYLGYFVLGYYIVHYGIAPKYQKILYLLAVPAAVCNVCLGYRLALWKGEPLADLVDSFGIFTFLIVVAIFVFFTARLSKLSPGSKSRALIREISLDTLGVYVMHIAMLECLEPLGIHSMLLPNIIGIPLYALFVFAVCSVLAAILRRIPLIGKYIC